MNNPTEDFLTTISKRLSSRSDCKNVMYVVRIENNKVNMYPDVYVYRSKHNRRPEDRMSILCYVQNVVKGLHVNLDVDGGIVIDDVNLKDGEYIYQSSFDNKRRKWRRLV